MQISRGGTNRSRSGGCSASEHAAAAQPGMPSYTRQSAPASGGTTSGGTGESGSGAETGGNEGGSTAPVFPETPNTEPGGLD